MESLEKILRRKEEIMYKCEIGTPTGPGGIYLPPQPKEEKTKNYRN